MAGAGHEKYRDLHPIPELLIKVKEFTVKRKIAVKPDSRSFFATRITPEEVMVANDPRVVKPDEIITGTYVPVR